MSFRQKKGEGVREKGRKGKKKHKMGKKKRKWEVKGENICKRLRQKGNNRSQHQRVVRGGKYNFCTRGGINTIVRSIYRPLFIGSFYAEELCFECHKLTAAELTGLKHCTIGHSDFEKLLYFGLVKDVSAYLGKTFSLRLFLSPFSGFLV
jgi:hypothetical protein